METVTVKGKVYQLGELYHDDNGTTGILVSATDDSFKLRVTGGTSWFCNELRVITRLGTIEDAPLELEDGEMFICRVDSPEGTNTALWYYGGAWWYDDKMKIIASDYNYIEPLYKMVKA